VPRTRPPKLRVTRAPASPHRPAIAKSPRPRRTPQRPPVRRQVARIIDEGDRTLVDVIDSLLNQGVVLSADLVLALANVDLVYVRLSALLCAADRIVPRDDT
jgi:hypothetical protein